MSNHSRGRFYVAQAMAIFIDFRGPYEKDHW